MEQALIRISGRVQGVFFRAFTQEKALALGLTGYAENLPDGSVIVVAQGTRENIEDLITALHDGSERANVEKVEVSWEEPSEAFEGFSTR